MKYEFNTPRYSPETIFRTYGTYVRTDKGDVICLPIKNGGGIKTKIKLLHQMYLPAWFYK